NVKPRSFWIDRFARHGFYPDLAYDTIFIASHALRFRRGAAPAPALDLLLAQRDRLRMDMSALVDDRSELERSVAQLSAHEARLREELDALRATATDT